MKNLKTVIMLALMLGGLIMFQGCKNPCKDVTCLNGGTCDEETGECQCAAGYEGADCGVGMNQKIAGTYSFTETCTPSGTDTYDLIIEVVAGSADSVILRGIARTPEAEVKGVLQSDGLTLSIPKARITNFAALEIQSTSASFSTDFQTISLAYVTKIYGDTAIFNDCTGSGSK